MIDPLARPLAASALLWQAFEVAEDPVAAVLLHRTRPLRLVVEERHHRVPRQDYLAPAMLSGSMSQGQLAESRHLVKLRRLYRTWGRALTQTRIEGLPGWTRSHRTRRHRRQNFV